MPGCINQLSAGHNPDLDSNDVESCRFQGMSLWIVRLSLQPVTWATYSTHRSLWLAPYCYSVHLPCSWKGHPGYHFWRSASLHNLAINIISRNHRAHHCLLWRKMFDSGDSCGFCIVAAFDMQGNSRLTLIVRIWRFLWDMWFGSA